MNLYTTIHELRQAKAEEEAYQMYKDEQDMAEWAEYVHHERNDRIAEAMEAINDLELTNFVQAPSQEREDLELAARLREVANRLEYKWK